MGNGLRGDAPARYRADLELEWGRTVDGPCLSAGIGRTLVPIGVDGSGVSGRLYVGGLLLGTLLQLAA